MRINRFLSRFSQVGVGPTPARPEGVYPDGRGGWYVKVNVGRDLLTGRRSQITRRGYRTAAAAAKARRELVGRVEVGQVRPTPGR